MTIDDRAQRAKRDNKESGVILYDNDVVILIRKRHKQLSEV